MISRSDDYIVQSHCVNTGAQISDHFCVLSTLEIIKLAFPQKIISFRKLQCIDSSCFKHDILESPLADLDTLDSPEELASTYYSALSDILNKHAPIKQKCVTIRPIAPWFDDDISLARRSRRKAERRWRATGLTVHLQNFQDEQ